MNHRTSKYSQINSRDLIACNSAAVDWGTASCSPPAYWQTSKQSCFGCGAVFTVQASEKKYWYEILRIPCVVGIVYCLECRKRSQAQRRIINRLAELSPAADKLPVDELDLREFVLLIAEGTLRRIRLRGKEDWILRGQGILMRGSTAIKRLLQVRQPQRDLLPILAHFHQRLGNAERMRRINDEIEQIRQTNPKTAKQIDVITAWMQAPTKKQLQRILKPQR